MPSDTLGPCPEPVRPATTPTCDSWRRWPIPLGWRSFVSSRPSPRSAPATSPAAAMSANQPLRTRSATPGAHWGGAGGLAQQPLELVDPERFGESGVPPNRSAKLPPADLGRLGGAALRRGEDRVRLDPDPCQESPEPLGLLPALVR